MTAIGWRAAAAGLTRRPVSGAGTRVGVGLGVGVAATEGNGDPDGAMDELPIGDGVDALRGGVLPSPATRPEPGAGEAAGAEARAANIPRPRPPRIARIPTAITAVRFIARGAVRSCVEPLETATVTGAP